MRGRCTDFRAHNLCGCSAEGCVIPTQPETAADAVDGGVLMETKQPHFYDPSCDPDAAGNDSSGRAVPEGSSPRRADVGWTGPRSVSGNRGIPRNASGQAGRSADDVIEETLRGTRARQSRNRDGITAVLDEVEAQRQSRNNPKPDAGYSYGRSDASAASRRQREGAARSNGQPKAAPGPNGNRRPVRQTASTGQGNRSAGKPQQKSGSKKKRKHYSFLDVLKFFVPWRGDSAFEAIRKIIFSTAIVVVGVCTFLISSYYIDLYKAKKYYEDIQAQIDEARRNRHFSEDNLVEDPETGEMIEWLEYNDIANRLLGMNPDLVGYVRIEGTEVSYPVVQKQKAEAGMNPNDYYLYRTFKQEYSKSGCIFMDFRNHFDEVVDHRRVVDNSGNVFIYGHNMNNRTMFGSLRDYVNNPSFYSAHPIVDYSSLYNDYKFKIFSVFIVDGEDYTSEYAFDCWNTLDFADEDAFYDYVNEAKKRTLINNDVDVKYGDQLLSLYTCNGLVANAKLILMCREVRAGEDLLEGTENATLNTNVLYPAAYYKYGRPVNYDPKKFVPFGPDA